MIPALSVDILAQVHCVRQESSKARFSYFRFLRSLITAERGIQCLKPLLPPFSAADDKNSQMVEQIGRGGDGGHKRNSGLKNIGRSTHATCLKNYLMLKLTSNPI